MNNYLPARCLAKKLFFKLSKLQNTFERKMTLTSDAPWLESIIFMVEPGVQASILEHLFFDEAYVGYSIIIVLLPGAHLSYTRSQELCRASRVHTNLTVIAHEQAKFEGWLIDEGFGTRTLQIDMKMIGAKADLGLRLASYVRGGTSDIISFQRHVASHTYSKVMVKGLVSEHSFLQFDGLVEIGSSAVAAEADLQHAALLLTSTARAVAKPALEVLTSEVNCQHGSAIGYVDSDEVWYLQARGLSLVKAEDLLKNAFMKEVLPLFS